ncbi:hypothetical protein [Pseudomonas sp. Ga0074129]|uniref:hypothetical protein n=1 Tax=Pseudomonas sp. Ga0074129 TaxID=1752219 RepID=UPI000A3EFC51|nr:hypothetical protein [Pseudomonas sp. Ga0074129]
MSTQWSYKKCLFCNGKIPYMPHWKNLPDKCNDCIFSEILDLPVLFKKFLEKESSHNQRYMSAEDLLSYKNREALRLKISEVLKDHALRNKDIHEACKEDKELLKLAISLHKNRNGITNSSATRAIPARIPPFMQGGAPGLGKRK